MLLCNIRIHGFAPRSGARNRLAPPVRVMTENQAISIGSGAPDFSLVDPRTGKTVAREDVFQQRRGCVIMFICNHCPFVLHLMDDINALAKEYQARGIGFVAISSNSVETHPQDGPEEMAKFAIANEFSFPYLYDRDQDVAKAYEAACTPEFYVYDVQSTPTLVYHGQYDSSRPSKYFKDSAPITGEDIRKALDGLLQGAPPLEHQVPSIGCNIKWKPGKEPAWFGPQEN